MPDHEFEHSCPSKNRKVGSFRYFIGMAMASTFSLIYFVVPFYMMTALISLLIAPMSLFTGSLWFPLLLSAITKPCAMPSILKWMNPMLEYFDFEAIYEKTPVDIREAVVVKGKNYLCVYQPHGALSYVGICAALNAEPAFQGTMKLAVADALLHVPLLKHVLGIFGLISASKPSMQRALKKSGPEGCVLLYVGGMAELFLSSEHNEIIFLKKRKGFIKLAMQSGVDVIPIYLFGNTTVLSVLKKGILADLSRKLQVSLTYIWGRWGLPIPRDCKLLYCSGQPLGMPHIPNPTQEDIDKWHAKYCSEVKRLFDTYKSRVPAYKDKELEIV